MRPSSTLIAFFLGATAVACSLDQEGLGSPAQRGETHTNGATSGPTTDAGGGDPTSPSAAPDAGASSSSTSSAPVSTPGAVTCNGALCAAGDVCCARLGGPSCAAADACDDRATILECDESADCTGGDRCCYEAPTARTSCHDHCDSAEGRFDVCASPGSPSTCSRWCAATPYPSFGFCTNG